MAGAEARESGPGLHGCGASCLLGPATDPLLRAPVPLSPGLDVLQSIARVRKKISKVSESS